MTRGAAPTYAVRSKAEARCNSNLASLTISSPISDIVIPVSKVRPARKRQRAEKFRPYFSAGTIMCGIFASVCKGAPVCPKPGLRQLLCNRGPDHVGETIATSNSGDITLFFTSTVLALRGGHIVSQPLSDPVTGSTLCWNGEAWKIGQVAVNGNDGEAVLALLTSGLFDLSPSDAAAHILGTLRRISGPSAFVFHDKSHDILYFGRDCLGRRSLMYNIEEVTGAVQFSSTADPVSGAWKEVEADGIYALDLANNTSSYLSLTAGISSLLEFPYPLYRFSWDSNIDSSISVSYLMTSSRIYFELGIRFKR